MSQWSIIYLSKPKSWFNNVCDLFQLLKHNKHFYWLPVSHPARGHTVALIKHLHICYSTLSSGCSVRPQKLMGRKWSWGSYSHRWVVVCGWVMEEDSDPGRLNTREENKREDGNIRLMGREKRLGQGEFDYESWARRWIDRTEMNTAREKDTEHINGDINRSWINSETKRKALNRWEQRVWMKLIQCVQKEVEKLYIIRKKKLYSVLIIHWYLPSIEGNMEDT